LAIVHRALRGGVGDNKTLLSGDNQGSNQIENHSKHQGAIHGNPDDI